jgi:hypothetical protein
MRIRLNQLVRILFYDEYLKVFLGVRSFKIEASKAALDRIRSIYYECAELSYSEIKDQDIKLITPLVHRGVFINDENRYADSISFHQITANPSPFHPDLQNDEIISILNEHHEGLVKQVSKIEQPFEHLMRRKVSRRQIISDPLSLSEIEKLLSMSYGHIRIDAANRVHKTVGSAGAMYPLLLYYIDLNTKKLYSFDGVSLHFQDTLSDDALSFARTVGVFTELADWSGIILILADISKITKKYGPKGYAFSLIEAGEVIQNTAHYMTYHGHDHLPVGSFVDEDVLKTVGSDVSTHIYIVGVLVK